MGVNVFAKRASEPFFLHTNQLVAQFWALEANVKGPFSRTTLAVNTIHGIACDVHPRNGVACDGHAMGRGQKGDYRAWGGFGENSPAHTPTATSTEPCHRTFKLDSGMPCQGW